jgi:ABC-type nitrate/sulfonate/bicarbonate transport system substrate-binding protein
MKARRIARSDSNRRPVLGAFLLAVMALVAAACGTGATNDAQTSPPTEADTATATAPADPADQAPEFEPVSVTFGLSGSAIPNQMVYAVADGGFLEPYNVTAEAVTLESSSVAMAALISGDAEFVFGARTEGILAQIAGQPILYVYKHSSGFLTAVTVSNEVAATLGSDPKSASYEDRLRALEGRLIATTSEGSILTLTIRNAMNEFGLEFEETYLQGTTMPAALASGNVDAYMYPSPFQESTEARGEGVILIEGNELPVGGPTAVQGPMYIREDYLQENRDVVVRVVAAFMDAAEWTCTNSDEARELAHSRFEDTDDEVFRLMWEQRAFDMLCDPLQHPLTEDDIQFLIENDAAPEHPEALNLNAADLMVPQDVIDEARALRARVHRSGS